MMYTIYTVSPVMKAHIHIPQPYNDVCYIHSESRDEGTHTIAHCGVSPLNHTMMYTIAHCGGESPKPYNDIYIIAHSVGESPQPYNDVYYSILWR